MTKEQKEHVESLLIKTVERVSKKAETAAELQSLAAVVMALVEVHRS